MEETYKRVFNQETGWESVRVYTEEEVLEILDKAFHMYASSYRQEVKKWFEEYKLWKNDIT